ncbi:MAG: riboflavin biosynthesis protein RibF [Acidobacteria bacterium]|nr:riboflavin biosynthesis protein RibF [Acidobacteriota bacterium]MDW7984331.1 riboflavin biosynthesis protein RibF [Acidobacteriota bacterium]
MPRQIIVGWTREGVDLERASVEVLTVGSFDGFHRGHQALIGYTVERARAIGARSVLMTFEPHPAKVVGRGAVRLLQAPEQRAAWLEHSPVDVLWVVPFTLALAGLGPEEFLEEYVFRAGTVREVVVGTDFRFGVHRSGDVVLLARMARPRGVRVWALPPVSVGDEPCRSSEVRRRLRTGDVEGASRLLGRPYALWGVIQVGEGLGRQIGFPTANLNWRNEVLPAPGVYVTVLRVGDRLWPSVTNVGWRPTVGGRRLQVEAHVLGEPGNLYGQATEFFFLKRIRAEQSFPSVEALRRQIGADVETARCFFTDRPVATLPADWFRPTWDGTWYEAHRADFRPQTIDLPSA